MYYYIILKSVQGMKWGRQTGVLERANKSSWLKIQTGDDGDDYSGDGDDIDYVLDDFDHKDHDDHCN